MFIGTPAYMSPEQAEFNASDIDTRTDIYALGFLLYELLTGQTPFERPPCMDHVLLERIIREPAPRPTQLNPQVPAVYDVILARALAKNPRNRYQDAAQFADDLRGLKQA